MSLDLPRMQRIRLSGKPPMQRALAWGVLMPNYRLGRVKITLEGLEHLPDEPVIFAMNHTDRYNYWPFQFQLWRERSRFTATWVKGKYYENELVARFMEWTNNIPTVSRGYLITRDFLSTMGRHPSDQEYRYLRYAVDAFAGVGSDVVAPSDPGGLETLFGRGRDMLGRRFDPSIETYAAAVNGLFEAMMQRFRELHDEAFDKGLDLLIFPQGTRSKRLSRGHAGIAQVALQYGKTIVPVGCNGSDRSYPGSSPLAKRGRIVYRIGAPITVADQAEWRPEAPFVPFTPDAEREHRAAFQGLVDVVMNRINDLVDDEYKFADDLQSEGVTGAKRFV